MDVLQLDKTDFTPLIYFNPVLNELTFDGVSRPENVMQFYIIVNDWVAEYESQLYKNHVLGGKKFTIHVIFKFSYFNSASAKQIFIFLESLRRIRMMGYPIDIDWYYDEGDDQMLEDGEELSDAIEIPFNFLEKTAE
jgi:SiaC family regulatory phosphoprotein